MMKRAYTGFGYPLLGITIALAATACGSQTGQGFGSSGGGSNGGGSGGGSNGGSGGGGSNGGSGGGSGSSGSPFGGSSGGGSGGGSSGSSNCAPGASQYIYVVSDDSAMPTNTLFTFNPKLFPAASAFTPVGQVPCVPAGSYVNSMAIDQLGTAYLNMNSDGSIWTMNTSAPLACTKTSFSAGQAGFSNDLGMAFAKDPSSPTGETLYVSDNHGPLGDCTATKPTMGSCWGLGLGKVDTTSWTLTRIGTGYTSSALGYNAELTGTGMSGTHPLFGFFTTSNPSSSYGPIDEMLGTTDNPAPTFVSVNIATGGYAFSFYGGDFYFYTAASGNTTPQHLSTATGTVTPGTPLTYTIVGAGASTCVPSVPPQ